MQEVIIDFSSAATGEVVFLNYLGSQAPRSLISVMEGLHKLLRFTF